MGVIGELIAAIAEVIIAILHSLYEIIAWPFRLLARGLHRLAELILRFAHWLSGGREPSPIARFLGWIFTLLLIFALVAFTCRKFSNTQIYRQVVDLIRSVLQEPQLPPGDSSSTEINSMEASSLTAVSPSLVAPTETSGTQPFSQASLSSLDNALDLDGVDDYVRLPALNLNSNTVTIEAWIKPDGFQNEWAGIVSSRAESTTAGLLILSDNEVRYIWNGHQYQWSSEAYAPPGVWSHVALVIEPTKATIYLNGVAHINSTNHLSEEFDGEMRVGHDAWSENRYFNGAFDDVKIWDTARSQEQIMSGMQIQLVGSEPGLIAYYTLDEGAPGSNNSNIITAHDMTGNHNGTLINFALEGSDSNWIASDASE